MAGERTQLSPRTCAMALIFVCFFLTSNGYLSWTYHLMDLLPPTSVDMLSMVVGYLFQAAGIGAYALCVRGLRAERLRLLGPTSLVLYLASLVPATLSQNLLATLALGFVSNLLCGIIAGAYLQFLAELVPQNQRGLTFGGAYAAATAASWLLSLPSGGTLLRGAGSLAVCAALTCAALYLMRLAWTAPPARIAEDTPHAEQADDERPTLILAFSAVLLMSLVKNAGYGFPSSEISGGISLELSRLSYGIGLVVAGLICDKSRGYGAMCCAAALVTPFLMLALAGEDAPGMVLWVMDYLLFGFFSVFRVTLFADLSDREGLAHLAPCGLMVGRAGDALGTALCNLLGGVPFALICATAMLFASTIVVLFLLCQQLYLPKADRVLTEQELFDRFAAEHDLSSRERDVLQLVLSNRSNGDIASELFVSESTVKFHVRNLLKKTGCKNRMELINAYTWLR